MTLISLQADIYVYNSLPILRSEDKQLYLPPFPCAWGKVGLSASLSTMWELKADTIEISFWWTATPLHLMIYAKNNVLPCKWGKGDIIAFLSIGVRPSRHVHPARGWGEGGDPQGSCQEVQVIVIQEETSSRLWVFSPILGSFFSVMSWASVWIQKMPLHPFHCFVSAVTQTHTNVNISLANRGTIGNNNN